MGYMHGNQQKAAMIQAGIDLWHAHGSSGVTARGVGEKVGRSHAGVLYHFDSVADLKWKVKCAAVERGDKIIIPQLITTNDPVVADWTDEQRRAWLGVT